MWDALKLRLTAPTTYDNFRDLLQQQLCAQVHQMLEISVVAFSFKSKFWSRFFVNPRTFCRVPKTRFNRTAYPDSFPHPPQYPGGYALAAATADSCTARDTPGLENNKVSLLRPPCHLQRSHWGMHLVPPHRTKGIAGSTHRCNLLKVYEDSPRRAFRNGSWISARDNPAPGTTLLFSQHMYTMVSY